MCYGVQKMLPLIGASFSVSPSPLIFFIQEHLHLFLAVGNLLMFSILRRLLSFVLVGLCLCYSRVCQSRMERSVKSCPWQPFERIREDAGSPDSLHADGALVSQSYEAGPVF